MLNAIFNILEFLVNLMPNSPFQMVEVHISNTKWLRYMNWVIPVGQFIAIFDLYCVALLAFFLWSQRHSYTKFIKNLVLKFFNLFNKSE